MSFSPLDSEVLGNLFSTESMREVFSDSRYISFMFQVEGALARAQAEHGLVPMSLATAIENVQREGLEPSTLARGSELSGVPTIPFVQAVQAKLPPDLEPYFHFGATTQDIADTARVLQIREALDFLSHDLLATVKNLASLAEKHRETPCVARTASQQAAPITFGYKVAGWCVALSEHVEYLQTLRPHILVVSLGGPVGTLAALGDKGPAVIDSFADILGLRSPPITWHTHRARIVETGSWLGILIGILGKIATDIISLSSTEVGEVSEPYEPGRGGSSAMPHKRNPISSMMILAAHGAAPGHVSTLMSSLASLHERPVGAWHAEWHALPALFGLASGALREARRVSGGISVNVARMRENLDLTNGLLFSDAAAAVLSRSMGRKQAHAAVEKAVSDVLAHQGSLLTCLAKRHRNLAEALRPAFDTTESTRAAARITDAAIAHARKLISALNHRA